MQLYTAEDYEFAIRILHHRKELKDEEVAEWMKNPGHVRLIVELADLQIVAGKVEDLNEDEVRRQLHRKIVPLRRIKRMVTIAACVLFALGCWQFGWMNIQDKSVQTITENLLITPGEAKALLILPEGKVVDLTSRTKEIEHSGNGIVLNDSLEGLKYKLKVIRQSRLVEEYHTIQVPVGGFYKLELADGTKVWLNAGTELRYPVCFTGTERNVFLKGEAYFQVAKDTNKPFQVHLEQAEVTVLGTSFNISAYPDENQIFTTLVDGKVKFHAEKSRQKIVMQPGCQCVMEVESGKTTLSQVECECFTSWINGRFVFRDMPLEVMMRQLQRWYDFEVVYEETGVKEYEFRGVIQRDSKIEDVFRAIELATDVKFRINGKQVIIEKR